MTAIGRAGSVAIVACLASMLLAASARADTKPPKLRRPRSGVQFTVGPVPVERGKEITECTYFKLPRKHDLDVNKVQISVSGGSHHVHLYRPEDPNLDLADGHEACNFALDFSVWQLILASQNLELTWRLPPESPSISGAASSSRRRRTSSTAASSPRRPARAGRCSTCSRCRSTG